MRWSLDYNAYIMIFVIIVLVVTFLIVNTKPIKKKKVKLVPFGYHLFYTDNNSKNNRADNVIHSKLLSSEKYNLQGKPDFIFTNITNRKYIPVELKSGVIADKKAPKDGDLLQLVAYFLIIEDLYNYKPRKGRLVYKDCMFVVKNTRYLRKVLLNTVKDMENMLENGHSKASNCFDKENYGYCRYCICRETVCEIYKK